MKELSDRLYWWVYEGQSLRTVGIVVGLLLLAAHLFALLRSGPVSRWLQALPRSRNAGAVILTIDFLWSWMIASSMDLGEFHRLRWLAQLALPAMYLLMLFWVNDYAGARAVGILLLLAACPVLNAAFLREPASRILLSLVCYVWILLGLFWVGMPYVMRDQIAWATRNDSRFRRLCIAGAAYGAVVLICAILFYGSDAAPA